MAVGTLCSILLATKCGGIEGEHNVGVVPDYHLDCCLEFVNDYLLSLSLSLNLPATAFRSKLKKIECAIKNTVELVVRLTIKLAFLNENANFAFNKHLM